MRLGATLVGVHTARQTGRRTFANCSWCGLRCEVSGGKDLSKGHCCRQCLSYESLWKRKRGIA